MKYVFPKNPANNDEVLLSNGALYRYVDSKKTWEMVDGVSADEVTMTFPYKYVTEENFTPSIPAVEPDAPQMTAFSSDDKGNVVDGTDIAYILCQVDDRYKRYDGDTVKDDLGWFWKEGPFTMWTYDLENEGHMTWAFSSEITHVDFYHSNDEIAIYFDISKAKNNVPFRENALYFAGSPSVASMPAAPTPFVASYRLVLPDDFNDEEGTCYARTKDSTTNPTPEDNYDRREFVEWGFASRDLNGIPLMNHDDPVKIKMFDYMQGVSLVYSSTQTQFCTFVMEQKRGHSTWLGHVRPTHNLIELSMDEPVHIRTPSAVEPFDLIKANKEYLEENYVAKAGDNMEGQLDMQGEGGRNKIVNLADPTEDYDASTKKYIDDKEEKLQNEIIELEEEIEALAPTLERGTWRFNPVGSASPSMFAMYGAGTSTSEYPQADQIFINTVDSDGKLHNFNDIEVNSYLEIFSPDDGDYGLYKVTGKSDETSGANAFWMFDVEHSRSNRPRADASLEDKCRVKFFTIAETIDPTSFVMKAGDVMSGDLVMDGSKIKTLFLDSGENSNLALQHDGNTKVYVGNTQTSFINHIKLNKDGVDDMHVVTKKYVDDLKKYVDDLIEDSSGGGSGSCININGGNLCASDPPPSWAEVIKGNPKVAELKVLNHHTDVQPSTEPCMCTANFDGDIKYWIKPAKQDYFKDGDSIYLKYVTGSSKVEDGPYTIKNVVETNVWNTFFISGGPRPKVGTECSISKTSKFDLSADGDGLRMGTETPEGYDSSGFVFGDYFHYLYSGYDSRKHDARVHCETGEEEIIWTFPYTPNGYSDNRTTLNDTGTIYVRARDVMEASSASNQAVIANGRLTEHDRVHDYTQYTFYSNSALASTWIKTCFSKNDTFFGVVRHKKVNDGVENKLVWINYKNDPTRPAKGSFDTVNITSQTDHHRVFRVRDEVYLTCDNLSEIYRFVGTGTSSISKDNWVKTGFRLPLKADGVTYETEIHQIAYLPDLDRYYLGGKHNGYLSQPSKGRVIGGNTFADCVPFGPFVWNYDADEEPLEIWHKHHLPHVSNGCVIQGVPKANYGVGTIFGSGYIIFDGSETYQIEGDPDNTNKFDYDEVQYVPPTSSKFCQNGPPHYYTQTNSDTGATSLFFGNGHYRYSHNNMYPNSQILLWNGVPISLGETE